MNGYCLGLVDLQLMAGRGNNIQTLRTAGSCFPKPFGGFFLLLHVRRRLEMNDSYIQCLKICRKKGATLTGLYRSLSHLRVAVACFCEVQALSAAFCSRLGGLVTLERYYY